MHRFVQRVVITSQEYMQVRSMHAGVHENAFNASLSDLKQKLFSAFPIVLVKTHQCLIRCVHLKMHPVHSYVCFMKNVSNAFLGVF
jgi:hypothetical protein